MGSKHFSGMMVRRDREDGPATYIVFIPQVWDASKLLKLMPPEKPFRVYVEMEVDD